jgi:L-ascorbate metabolism protein UlaG (beta-lactamase superfamily)
MEITWYGAGCVRLRGKEGVVVADGFRSVVGPTGRGLTADIATYSHADPTPVALKGDWTGSGNGAGPTSVARPTSLEPAFLLDEPGEFEVHDVLITGVRTFRDDANGAERGPNVSYVYELDGLHAVQLGDIGHLLTEEQLGEIGTVDIVCVPVGGALPAARAAELVAQLDAKLVVPLLVGTDEQASAAELEKFRQEMGGAEGAEPQPKLSVTISTIPEETTLVELEPRKL